MPAFGELLGGVAEDVAVGSPWGIGTRFYLVLADVGGTERSGSRVPWARARRGATPHDAALTRPRRRDS